MAKKLATHPPRIDPLRLGELAAGDADELRPQGRYEGLRFQGIDLSGRDLGGIEFTECALDDVQAHATGFRAATFSEVEFSRFNAPVLAAPRSRWRDVTMDGSRVGSAELYESYINSARFSGSKLGFVNARGAQLLDVAFDGCTIDELDLSGASLTRVSFTDTTVRSLSLAGAKLTHVDLRGAEFAQIDGFESLSGATLSGYQVGTLAASFAAHLGIVVDD
ncbi:pentapeptide repeat-containing protein [Conyzicola sp.]|uniref:pentapeptide repeat-containing protein n=1 Tax=Conyzicola sp. TaxID=1969404 RepID=UPI00398A30CB